ncbi:hypothetical protein K3495_g3648 [Podosphaera aphanis]|nr:hypothetical protein K3495_g3648 [Podosphaera aphanis]
MVAACVLPVAHFGAETWWPGKTKVRRGKVVSTRVGSHLEALDKVHRACARAILPVFRTTPSTALMREAGISPAQIELDNIARRAAVRTRKLDSRHPLYMHSQASSSSPATSRFSRWCRTVPPSEQVDPLAHPFWEIKESRENSLLRVGAPTVSNDGYVIYQLGLKVCIGAVPLGNSKEIFDAEAFAALCGIVKAVSLSSARFASNVWVFLDNLEVAIQLLSGPCNSSSQNIFSKATELANKWKTRERLPHTSMGQVSIRWVPGHSGVEGNKLADLQAKKGASMTYLDPPEYSLASLKNWQEAREKESREEWWRENIPQSYSKLEINSAPRAPKELLFTRRSLGQLIAARTGHGDFAAYHSRFNHKEARMECLCGSRKTPTHFLFCRILRRRGGRPPGPINQLLPNLLGTPEEQLN